MRKLYVGIDLGTSSVKMGLFDAKMVILSKFQKVYQYEVSDNGEKEIDPHIWLQIVFEGLKSLLGTTCQSDQVETIAITGQMHTTVVLDAQGHSIRPAIIWNDTRTKNMVSDLKQGLKEIGENENYKILSTGSPLANLVWIKKNEPEHFKSIRHFLMPVDYLVYKLTGVYSTDYCDASTSSMYDFDKDDWSTTICEKFGIDSHILPTIKSSSEIAGKLQSQIKRKLKINNNISVIIGTGDNAATAFANKLEQNQQPLISLGTSGVVVIPNQHGHLKRIGKNIVFQPQQGTHTVLTQGTVQTGAILNNWWLHSILNSTDTQGEQASIPETLLGENNVLFFPHLNGEKTLYANANIRGAFVGLDLETKRSNLYLAVLEGLAFACRQLYEKMRNSKKIEYIQLVGGGAKSNLWLSIFANVFNIPVHVSVNPKEALEGVVMLAMSQDSVENTDNDFESIRTVYPHESIARKYELQYMQYLKMTNHILTLYD